MKPDSSSAPLGPFFEAVRRRHPDVDLVVLPGTTGPDRDLDPGPDRPSGKDPVRAVRERLVEQAARWWSAVGDEPESTELRCRYGANDGTIVVVSRLSGHAVAGPDSWSRLLGVVRRDVPTLREAAHVPDRWTGDLHGLRVLVSSTSGRGLLLELGSPPIHVGHRRARELAGR